MWTPQLKYAKLALSTLALNSSALQFRYDYFRQARCLPVGAGGGGLATTGPHQTSVGSTMQWLRAVLPSRAVSTGHVGVAAAHRCLQGTAVER